MPEKKMKLWKSVKNFFKQGSMFIIGYSYVPNIGHLRILKRKNELKIKINNNESKIIFK